MKVRRTELPGNEGVSHVDVAAGESDVQAELAQLTSYLAVKSADGHEFDEVRKEIDQKRNADLEQRLNDLCGTSLPAWIYLRNPLWVALFILQSHLARKQLPSWTMAHRLEQLLGRAQFSRKLSRHTAEQLRRLIRQKEISAWSALSLIRSTGCAIRKDGQLEPNATGMKGLLFGSVCGGLLGFGFLVFIAHLWKLGSMDCFDSCEFLGLLILSQWMLFFLVLTFSLTWGRHVSAKRLQSISAQIRVSD